MIPKSWSGNPSHCRSQLSVTCSNSVAAGALFHSMPFTLRAAESISARMLGMEDETEK